MNDSEPAVNFMLMVLIIVVVAGAAVACGLAFLAGMPQ